MANNLSAFLKKNKKSRPNVFYAASADFVDENGKPVLWELRSLTTAEHERIRDDCMYETKDAKGRTVQKMDNSKLLAKMAAASIVYPNLYDAALQDDYGVKTPEALLKEMIDNPGEYAELMKKVTAVSGFDQDIEAEIEEAKN